MEAANVDSSFKKFCSEEEGRNTWKMIRKERSCAVCFCLLVLYKATSMEFAKETCIENFVSQDITGYLAAVTLIIIPGRLYSNPKFTAEPHQFLPYRLRWDILLRRLRIAAFNERESGLKMPSQVHLRFISFLVGLISSSKFLLCFYFAESLTTGNLLAAVNLLHRGFQPLMHIRIN